MASSDAPVPVLVVGWDASDRGRDALALARVLARERGAALEVVYAHPDWSHYPLEWEAAEEVASGVERALEGVPAELLEGVAATKRDVAGCSPAEALQRAAASSGAETIVIGSTHHGPVGRVVPGSVAANLLQGAPCAVAIAPVGYAGSEHEQVRVVAAAFDGSDESYAAARAAAVTARRAHAALRLVAVVEPTAYGWAGAGWASVNISAYQREYFESALAELSAELSDGIDVQVRVREGAPPRELLAEVEDGVDLLVMGSRGYGPVRRVLLGSVSSAVMRSAPCPVLVPPRCTAERGGEAAAA